MENSKSKVWYRIEISTEDQNVSIYPEIGHKWINVEATELDGSPSKRIMLDRSEMELLVAKMEEMMKYVES